MFIRLFGKENLSNLKIRQKCRDYVFKSFQRVDQLHHPKFAHLDTMNCIDSCVSQNLIDIDLYIFFIILWGKKFFYLYIFDMFITEYLELVFLSLILEI